ncbi:hypothetical protein MMC20_001253, partial [Loxospora ochrophaea]|nr:hypothetical protein [Loxospora ochrophaea]
RQKNEKDEDWNGVWHYEDAPFIAVANIVSTVLSSLLPILSILVLDSVRDPRAKLWAIAVFTTLFSLMLATVTNAKRTDVFATTTA